MTDSEKILEKVAQHCWKSVQTYPYNSYAFRDVMVRDLLPLIEAGQACADELATTASMTRHILLEQHRAAKAKLLEG